VVAWSDEVLQAGAYEHVVGQLLRLEPLHPLSAERFREMTEAARREFPMAVQRVREAVKSVLELRELILKSARRYPGLDGDVARLAPPDFLVCTPPDRLRHLPRYLKAVMIRAERAVLHPARDSEKAALLGPYAGWEKRVSGENREAFRWLLEEYRVSIFAQELGTAVPVSPKRLAALMIDPSS